MGVQIRFTKINLGFGAKIDFSVVAAHFSVVGAPFFLPQKTQKNRGEPGFAAEKGPGTPGGGAPVGRFWQFFPRALDKSGLFAPQ
jgi:hypothetical protein